MDCEFGEKISLLIDGELPPEETEGVKAHLASCAGCRQLEKDFLYLRRQIKESVPQPAAVSALEGAGDFARAAGRKVPFWKKRILLPAPVFVLLLFVLAAAGVWAITANLNARKDATVSQDAAKNAPAGRPPLQNAQSEISLSRFDRGGRAEIYTIHRQASSEAEKLRGIKQ